MVEMADLLPFRLIILFNFLNKINCRCGFEFGGEFCADNYRLNHIKINAKGKLDCYFILLCLVEV